MADAEIKQANHESAQRFVKELSNGTGKMTDKSAKAYYGEFVKVIEAADVILQICDARDPMGTRCKQVEEAVLNNVSKGKLPLSKNGGGALGGYSTIKYPDLRS